MLHAGHADTSEREAVSEPFTAEEAREMARFYAASQARVRARENTAAWPVAAQDVLDLNARHAETLRRYAEMLDRVAGLIDTSDSTDKDAKTQPLEADTTYAIALLESLIRAELKCRKAYLALDEDGYRLEYENRESIARQLRNAAWDVAALREEKSRVESKSRDSVIPARLCVCGKPERAHCCEGYPPETYHRKNVAHGFSGCKLIHDHEFIAKAESER